MHVAVGKESLQKLRALSALHQREPGLELAFEALAFAGPCFVFLRKR